MTDSPDSPRLLLGDVLAHALDRAVGTSLDSLQLLRVALRNYVRHQHGRGVPLDNVMLAVSAVLLDLEDERIASADAQVLRDPELATQLSAWCSADYSAERSN